MRPVGQVGRIIGGKTGDVAHYGAESPERGIDGGVRLSDFSEVGEVFGYRIITTDTKYIVSSGRWGFMGYTHRVTRPCCLRYMVSMAVRSFELESIR